jgi:hypothetical protein
MTIPKGSEFVFIVTIVQKDSFLPQDLTDIDLPNCSFKLTKLSDLCDVTAGTVNIEVADAVNGKLKITLSNTLTETLDVIRGEAVDNYYLKPVYQGLINVKFTDATPERTAIIEKVYVAPTGAACV